MSQDEHLEVIARFLFEQTCQQPGRKPDGFGQPWAELSDEIKDRYRGRVKPVLEAMCEARLVIVPEAHAAEAFRPPERHSGLRPVIRLFERDRQVIDLGKKGG